MYTFESITYKKEKMLKLVCILRNRVHTKSKKNQKQYVHLG